MKRTPLVWLTTLLVAIPLLVSGRDEHERQGLGGMQESVRQPGSFREGRSIIKMRTVSVPRPERIESPVGIVNDNRRINEPVKFETGAAITQHSALLPPQHHNAVAGNRAVVGDIMARQRGEGMRNHYYWHTAGGVRYAHYFDDHNVHWYGFYHGPSFYWTRFYENRWWWFDPGFARWVFWWDGYWWWQGPGAALYVYVDNSYYPYEAEQGNVIVKKPETMLPPDEQPASPSEGRNWTSPDGKRMVQLTGPRAEAFLYSVSGSSEPVFAAYLGQGVEKVRFSGGKPGQPLQILLDFKDGTFALYDIDGNALDGPVPPPSGVKQPPATDSVPPPPTSAPGQ
ncbi:MAG: hypothetical protein PHP45_01900 [Elusimicrobiales bacterium]|nr:hypothetical protein [Elusimicrobiales bacterium]